MVQQRLYHLFAATEEVCVETQHSALDAIENRDCKDFIILSILKYKCSIPLNDWFYCIFMYA